MIDTRSDGPLGGLNSNREFAAPYVEAHVTVWQSSPRRHPQHNRKQSQPHECHFYTLRSDIQTVQKKPPATLGRHENLDKGSDMLIQFRLLENALDFLDQAAIHARRDSSRDWKYALLHLASGVELLLKARLQEEDWTLIFQEPSSANTENLRTGEFESVKRKELIMRLKCRGIELEFKTKNSLDIINKFRNKLIHFEVNVEEKVVKSLLGQGFAFALLFIRQSFPEDKHNVARKYVNMISVALSEFEEFVNERLRNLQDELGEEILPFCPSCGQETLVLGKGDPHCLFCELTGDPEEIAFFDGGVGVGVCPKCDGPCYDYVGQWDCFKCGSQFEDCLRLPLYQRKNLEN